MANKLSVTEQAAARKELYDLALAGIGEIHEVETVSDGALVHLPNDQFALIKIVIKDPTKFDLATERAAYADKLAGEKERAEKSAAVAAKKAEKLAEREKKAAEKAAKEGK